jgi:hypothetical protein
LVCDSDFHVNHRVLLHAAILRHGTNGFTSLPKEGVLWIFPLEKSDGRVRTHNLGYCTEAAPQKDRNLSVLLLKPPKKNTCLYQLSGLNTLLKKTFRYFVKDYASRQCCD